MNPDLTTKRGHPDLLYQVLGRDRRYLFVHYLYKLLNYGYQISTTGASDVAALHQLTDSPTFDLLFKVTGVKI